MNDALMRLVALCAICAATEQMRLGSAVAHVCSLCVIEALIEILAGAFKLMG